MSGKTEKLIHIDAKSCYFELLSDVLIDQKTDGIWNWETLQIVLQLGAQYKFLRVPESLRDKAGRVGREHRWWTIFEFASQNDFPELARQMIPDMWHHYFRYDGKDIPRKAFESVPGPYASAFMVAMNAHPTRPIPHSGAGAQDTEPGRWEKIAKDFNPFREYCRHRYATSRIDGSRTVIATRQQ
jgi:hypothetical protein